MSSWLRFGAVIVGLLLGLPADASIPEFFRELFSEYRSDYADQHQADYSDFCRTFDLDPAREGNHRTFHQITFFHDLLTGTGASNCVRGGFLGIPYFWHWVDPNPRHSIVLHLDSVPLSTVPPPEPYTRYRTYADIDRVPVLYLSDLVGDSPKYSHPNCGSFFTFGWCSEREMAYVALMAEFGYQGKVQQSGIHTWSSLWCPCTRTDGTTVILAANVDNTFDTVHWEAVPAGTSLSGWLEHVGRGTEIAWYNRVARSPEQLAGLRVCQVSDAAKDRIRMQVRAALRRVDRRPAR